MRIPGLNKLKIPILIFLYASLFNLAACSSCNEDDAGCHRNSDCNPGEMCIAGNCEIDTFGDTGTATDSNGSDSSVSSDSTIGTDTGSVASTDSDSETEFICTEPPSLASGEACAGDCECLSGHCTNGFCCASGVCCAQSGNCPVSPCGMQHCVSNSCIYTFDSFPCGTTTSSGDQTCDGQNVCDGAGNCIAALQSCAPYAADSTASNCAASPAELSCYTSCTAANADTNCAPGNICQDGKCVSPAGLANGNACTTGNECLSGHCANGFCCDSGECCGVAADCGDLCIDQVQCSAQFNCVVESYVGCGGEDTSGDNVCNAGQRCDGAGGCLAVEACRTDNAALSYTCTSNSVVQNCSCDNNDDCDADTEFCNDGYICIEGICDFSVEAPPCASNPCRTGVTCDETARACTPGANPCDAVATTCDPTSCVSQDDDTYQCVSDPADDGVACDDELGCNGTADYCLTGECVPGGVSAEFCYDENPCAAETTCTENGFGLEPTCTAAADRVIGDDCSSDFSCFGDGGTCQVDPDTPGKLICIQSEEVCASNGICAQYACSEDYTPGSESGVACLSLANGEDASTLTCDNTTVTIAVADGKFTTRTYFNYNATCNPDGDSFQGMETRIYLSLGQPVTDATLTVTDVDSAFAGNLELLLFDSNPCIETNCIQRGTNVLTFSSADSNAIVVLDSIDALWPPATVTLELNCNL